MVSKSYVVNKCPSPSSNSITGIDREDECVKNTKMQNSDQKSRFDRYILHISNEMVKMKPSKPSNMFRDDNSQAPKYWNTINIVRWNRECINEAKIFFSPRQLLKIAVVTLFLVGLGCVLISWLRPETSPTITQNVRLVNVNKNLSITNSSMTEGEPPMTTQITRLQNEAFHTTSTHQPSSDVIPHHDEHVEESKSTYEDEDHHDDVLLLTKKYVDRINFYTTSNANLFSVKVSPTLPTIRKHSDPPSELPIQSYANENSCQSTSLPLCQGVLSYDLTDPQQKWNLTNVEYQHFQHLLNSECSKRVAEFVCHMLEPECRPTRMENLKPCRRICKGIFESCSHIIASSEVLTEFFDCNTYADSNDHTVCEDITRFTKKCYDDEFQCSDYSCVPSKWRCDNIRDCPRGEDEKDCKFCNYDEFKCVSDKKCISDKWFCDGVEDCIDGSDEMDCEIESDEEDDRSVLYFDEQDYATAENDHNDADGDDALVSTGDAAVPMFINPNATTIITTVTNSTTVKTPKRFRSTMRKPTAPVQQPSSTTPPTPEETTTVKRKIESVKASTSHLSPCPEFELRCVDGLCITLDQICDKIQDCSDNSDELHCEY